MSPGTPPHLRPFWPGPFPLGPPTPPPVGVETGLNTARPRDAVERSRPIQSDLGISLGIASLPFVLRRVNVCPVPELIYAPLHSHGCAAWSADRILGSGQ